MLAFNLYIINVNVNIELMVARPRCRVIKTSVIDCENLYYSPGSVACPSIVCDPRYTAS